MSDEARELDRLKKMRHEWEIWRTLCRHLEGSGAVNRGDLESSPAENTTAGQLLLSTIREWGEALVDLRRVP